MTMTAPPTGHVRVVARIRPLSAKELERGSKETVTALCNNNQGHDLVQVQTTEKRWFELDAVFAGNSTQDQVYHQSGAKKAVCDDIFKGYNATILAYGQTGAGKTFSMGTAAARPDASIQEHDGIIPRAVQDLFDNIEAKCEGNAKVTLSYLELYNEEIRDLFAENVSTKNSGLKIRENLNGEIYVAGAVAKEVASPADIGRLMAVAADKRVVASTAMNAVSSRSHAICVIRVEGLLVSTDDDDVQTDKFSSKLTLVDLAGSERIKKTGAEGTRRAEGININKSLLVLGQVVSALSDSGKRQRKPPYRDSKLTRLLQDSLGGNSRTIMVACVSPADFNVDESINTLRYATSARNIKNKATQNLVKNISPEEAAKLQRENQLLKTQVAELQEMLKKMSSKSESTANTTSDENDESAVPGEIDVNGASTSGAAGGGGKEVEELKAQLSAARTEAQKVIEIPTLHLEISQLKEQLAENKEILEENLELRRELDEVKADAESSRMAASYLTEIVDQLKEIKRDEVDRKLDQHKQIVKEQNWIAFVNVMMENNRMQIQQLKSDFSRVVRTIENLDFTEDVVSPDTTQDDIDNTSHGDGEDESETTGQDELLRKAVELTKKHERFLKKSESTSDDSETGVTKPLGLLSEKFKRWKTTRAEARRIMPWKECTEFFKNRLREIEEGLNAETKSLKDIMRGLGRDQSKLEREIGKKQLESRSMDEIEGDALVEQLSVMLMGQSSLAKSAEVDISLDVASAASGDA